MHDDQLKKLLQLAEADIGLVPVPDDLAGRVRKLDHRRRRNRRLLAIVAPVAMTVSCLALWKFQISGDFPAAVQIAGPIPSENDTIEQLEAQASFHRRVALEIIALGEQDQARLRDRASWSEPEPAELVREQLEAVAYRMILRAEALRAAMRPDEEALAIYRDILRLFPDTSSARQAREHLSRLGHS